MDKDRKDKTELSGAQSAPEGNAPRGPIEGRYRTAKPAPASGDMEAAQPAVPEEEMQSPDPVQAAPESAVQDEDLDDVMIPTPLEKKPPKRKKARKKKKALPLLITLGVFVLLFAGYAAMVWLIPEKEIVDDTPLKEYKQLISYTSDQIAAVDFHYGDGYSYKLNLTRYVNESGYTVTAYGVEGKSEFEYDQDLYGNMILQIAQISSGTIASQQADLSTYGLENPKVSVTYYIRDEEGNVSQGLTLHVGNAAPVGNGHYAILDGDDTVYVIGYSDADYLVMTDYDYRVLTLLTIDDYVNGIQSVGFTRDEEQLYVARATTEEKAALEYATTYRIYEPALVNCNTYYLEDKVLQHLTSISALSVVEDYPQDLADYGLSEADSPLEVSIETIDGTVTRFTLSNTPNEDGSIYGKVSGQTSIYTFDPSVFAFASVTYDQILDMTIWTCEFNSLDRVEFILDGKTHTLQITDNGDGTYQTRLDELDILETDARMLYVRILQIYIDDITRDGDTAGKIAYSFYLYGKDGTVRTLELAAISDRRFVVILDGVQQEYCVRYNTVKQILDGIEDLYEGLHLTYSV